MTPASPSTIDVASTPEIRPVGTMSLRGHLGELRDRLIRAALWLVIGGALAFWQWEWILQWLQEPFLVAKESLQLRNVELVTRQAQGGLVQVFRVVTAGAIVLASPMLLLEAWGFVAPGLTKKERIFAGSLLPVAMVLFFCGCAFGYYVLFPPMVAFMLQFNARVVTFQTIEISEYLALITNLMIALGAAFQIPVISFVLARLGLVSSGMLGKLRRHALVGSAILAAIITPTPDAFNMALLAVPLYLLYEISVLVAFFGNRKKPPPLAPSV